MRARLRAQVAGRERIEALLKATLADRSYRELRILIAFARWSGLYLIDTELRAFTSRGRLDAIVGVDLGGTTAEALDYMLNLRNTRVRICRSGNPVVVFHPKVFSFAGSGGWRTIIGSANATAGGLFSNAEVVVDLSGTAKESNPFDPIWERFSRPDPPYGPEHISEVTTELLDDLAPDLARWQSRPPDRGRRQGGTGPPAIDLSHPLPRPGRPPRPLPPARKARRQRAQRGLAPIPPKRGTTPSVLYMEVWDETGGGTQVQFPKRVVHEYFGASEGQVTWVTLDTPDGREVNRVQIFSNNTFRVPLRFMASRGRPAVVRMTRTSLDTYRVEVRSRSDRGYQTWLSRCTNRTRSDSKRYGLE